MKKFIKKVVLILIIVIGMVVGIVTYQGYSLYKNTIEKLPIETMVSSIRDDEKFVRFDQLPKDYINAVIAVEDRRFYSHNGIDLISIGRAIVTDIKNMSLVEGGSTITQQVAKNNLFTQEKKATRKIAEMFAARDIEEYCSKEEILELYVNTSYFGDGYYCVKDASEGYFNKEPKEMNLYESTLLAGIPNAPSVYAPTKNPELAKQRQEQVIEKMIANGYLTEEKAEEIGFKQGEDK